ncbi:MAG: pyruvate dehydrogenase [Armatimonadetes bacterium OLB18]|nr:MAG: pyruvate dehydrogenase [Armatimonadetes bacterium OLB18]
MAVAELTYRDALRAALVEEMDRNPDVFLIGEDIGKYKGTFRVTDGLFEKYAAEPGDWLVEPFGRVPDDGIGRRVIDTPITEPAIVGFATGAAMTGLRPVVEMMTMSFSILAIDQIINHAAKVHYMTGGQFTVPLVIRGPGGAAHQLSAQHSHSLEGWYAHVPGLRWSRPLFLRMRKGSSSRRFGTTTPSSSRRTLGCTESRARSATIQTRRSRSERRTSCEKART